MPSGGAQPPSRRREFKKLKIQVASHVDVQVSLYVYLSPRAWTAITALGAGGWGGWWFYLRH